MSDKINHGAPELEGGISEVAGLRLKALRDVAKISRSEQTSLHSGTVKSWEQGKIHRAKLGHLNVLATDHGMGLVEFISYLVEGDTSRSEEIEDITARIARLDDRDREVVRTLVYKLHRDAMERTAQDRETT